MNGRVCLKAENDRLLEENARLCEEIRIKDARRARIDSHRRPPLPTDRADDHPGIPGRKRLVARTNRLHLPGHGRSGWVGLMDMAPMPWSNSASPSTSFRTLSVVQCSDSRCSVRPSQRSRLLRCLPVQDCIGGLRPLVVCSKISTTTDEE